MSNAAGPAYGDIGEIYGAALGGSRIDGAAIGNTIIWQQGPELYEIISIDPAIAQTNQAITVTVSCNKNTKGAYMVNEYGSNMGTWGTSVTQSDGTYKLSTSFSVGSTGNRSFKIYGTAISSPASQLANNLSLNYLTVNVQIVAAVTTDATGDITAAQYVNIDGQTETVQIDSAGGVAGLARNMCLVIDDSTEVIQNGPDATNT